MSSGPVRLALAGAAFVACSTGPSNPVGGDAATSVEVGVTPQDTGPPDASTTLDARDAAMAPEAGEAGNLECPYPAGPYGTNEGGATIYVVGDVLDPKLQWQAYAPGATTPSTLRVADLYDCSGKKGINAIVLDTSAQWCPSCQFEAQSAVVWMGSTGTWAADWTSLGVAFVTLLFQNAAYMPATIANAEQWRTTWNEASSIYVAADPNHTFDAPPLPHVLLVDPRTMKVARDLDLDNYGPEANPNVTALATMNKK